MLVTSMTPLSSSRTFGAVFRLMFELSTDAAIDSLYAEIFKSKTDRKLAFVSAVRWSTTGQSYVSHKNGVSLIRKCPT